MVLTSSTTKRTCVPSLSNNRGFSNILKVPVSNSYCFFKRRSSCFGSVAVEVDNDVILVVVMRTDGLFELAAVGPTLPTRCFLDLRRFNVLKFPGAWWIGRSLFSLVYVSSLTDIKTSACKETQEFHN